LLCYQRRNANKERQLAVIARLIREQIHCFFLILQSSYQELILFRNQYFGVSMNKMKQQVDQHLANVSELMDKEDGEK
jgi:hypothetical protein